MVFYWTAESKKEETKTFTDGKFKFKELNELF